MAKTSNGRQKSRTTRTVGQAGGCNPCANRQNGLLYCLNGETHVLTPPNDGGPWIPIYDPSDGSWDFLNSTAISPGKKMGKLPAGDIFANLRMVRIIRKEARKQAFIQNKEPQIIDRVSYDRIMEEVRRRSPKAGLGDGKILEWIVEHREEILAIAKIIVTIALLFIENDQSPESDASGE